MKTFLANLLRVYAANIVAGVLGVLFVPFAAHRLGAVGYGLVSMYTLLVAYVALVELGLGRGVIQQLGAATDDAGRTRVLRTAAGLYAVVCGSLLVALPLLVWVVPTFVFPVPAAQLGVLRTIVVVAVVEYVVGVPASLLQNRALADQRFAPYSRFVLVTALVRYGVSFGVLMITTRPDLFAAAMAVRRLADVVLARVLLGPLPPGAWRPAFDRTRFRTLVRSSSAMSVGQALNVSVVAAGSILVNARFGIAALGTFRAAFDLASKLWFFSNAIGLIVFPKFVQLWARPDARAVLTQRLPRLLLTSVVGYSLVAVVGVAAGPTALDVLGLESTVSATLFALLVIGVSVNAHCGLAYEFLQASGGAARAALVMAFSLVVLVATFAATADLVPGDAIGWAWVVSQVAAALVWDAFVLRRLDVGARALGAELALRASVLGGVVLVATATVGVAPRGAYVVAAACAAPAVATVIARTRFGTPHPASA